MRIFLLTVTLAACAVGPARGQALRGELDLTGGWQLAEVGERFAGAKPPGNGGKPAALPCLSGGRAVWLRQRVTPPEAWAGKRIALRVQQANYRTELFVNGVSCGTHDGGFGSFEIEADKQLRTGQPNELWLAVSGPPVNEAGLSPDGVGYGTNWVWGVWGKTVLTATDRVHVRDLFVSPSFRHRRLTVQVDAAAGRAAQLRVRVLDAAGKMVLESPAVAPDDQGRAELRLPWAAPHLWSPDDPYLYRAVAQVLVAGRVVDEQAVRFGFREFWIDGPHFLFNGKRINLRGDGWHNRLDWTKPQIETLFYKLKSLGINVYRGHGPHLEVWQETADEMGMLLVAEGPFYQMQNTDLKHPEFWNNARRTCQEWVRRVRNHPSVIMYSANNEVVNGYDSLGGYAPEKEKAHAELDLVKSVQRLAGFIRETDPTRPVEHEGDGDLGDVVNMHYPHEAPFFPLYPNTAYWPLDAPAACTWKYKPWDGRKPLYIGEFSKLWEGSPRTVCFLGGEAVYADLDVYYQAFGELMRQSIIGYRASGAAGIALWNTSVYAMTWRAGQPPVGTPVLDGIAAGFKPEALFIKEFFTRSASGGDWCRTLQLFNDSLYDRTYRVGWRLADARGAVLGQGEKKVVLAAGHHAELAVSGRMPVVTDGVRPVVFTADMSDGAAPVARVVQDLRVFPASDRYRVLRHVSVINAGLAPFPSLPALPETARSGDVLILARAVLDEPTRARVEALAGRGVHVILLEPASWPAGWLGLAEPEGATACTLAFGLAPGHPALARLDAKDFCYWADDHLVSSRLLCKPSGGPLLTLVESGGNRMGMKFAALAQGRIGNGMITVCALNVLEKIEREPAARQLLYNLVNQAVPEVRPAAVEQLTGRALAAQSPGQITALRATVMAGKTVLITEVEPAGLLNLRSLTGQPLALVPAETFQLRKNGSSPLLWGISNDDLCSIIYNEWGSEFRAEGTVRWPITRFAFEPASVRGEVLLLTTRLLEVSGLYYGDALCQLRNASRDDLSVATNSLAAMIRIPAGKGAVVVSQVSRTVSLPATGKKNTGTAFWDLDRYDPNAVRGRFYSALLNNLK
ncbi:MAG: glycoside hydrolase family 2 TIM barrel-domain containing protein [Lentisphaeria bacterium]